MNDKCFFDTNMLVYLYSQDEPDKQHLANELIKNHTPIISTQVLTELSNVLRKKFQCEYKQIQSVIAQIINVCQVSIIQPEDIITALQVAEKYKYSFYDSLIISVALSNKCTMLYTEDLQHQQVIDNTMTIINPFVMDS
jgi:predicted nucleic acid-binding protein